MTIESINAELCTGCGICVEICPLDNLRLDTFQKEISPCRSACPAHVDIRSYNYLLKQNRVDEALDLFLEEHPFPAITGRVCAHPCEKECARNKVDAPVNINAIERFLGDLSLKRKVNPPKLLHIEKIAIVGSGPAGLSAAYFIRKAGYRVHVFESENEIGGMLRYGLQSFRLPKKVLDDQIKILHEMGIEFTSGKTIGKDIQYRELKDQGYKAFFLALGTQESKTLNLDGVDTENVVNGLDYLKRINCGNPLSIKGKVMVIGGGNVAIDVSLTALRLGATGVELVCLECFEEMPAHPESIQQALDEGVKIHPGYGPNRISQKNGKIICELMECSLVFDDANQFNPTFDENCVRTEDADLVVFAVGQTANLQLIPKGVRTTPQGTIDTDPNTLATSLPGVFAGGDAVSGPAAVVQAIADGKKASIFINRYLRGHDLGSYRDKEFKVVGNLPGDRIEIKERIETATLPVKNRRSTFDEIKIPLSKDSVFNEVSRCMTCGSKAYVPYDDCMTCFQCEMECPVEAPNVHPFKLELPLPIQYDEGDEFNV